MLQRIIRHDLRILAADHTLLLVAVLFTLLIAYGVYNGASWMSRRTHGIREAERAAAANLDMLRSQVQDIQAGRKTLTDLPAAGRPSAVSVFAYVPPTALTPLSIGASDLLPYSTTVNLFSTKDTLVTQSETDNPVNLLAGRFDLAFVIVYLYPLLILALSYNLLSQEREQGTLQLTLAQPVRLRTLAFGKVLARGGVIFLVLVVVSIIAVLLSGANPADEGTIIRLALWVTGVAAYTAFWFAVAVLVNAFGKSSATNAAALIAVWLVFVVIYPALLNVAAASLHPLPSRLAFINDVRDAENETNAKAKDLLAKYLTDHPELAPGDVQANLDDAQMRRYAQRQAVERLALERTATYDEQLRRQQQVINRYGLLSPAIVMQETLNHIAGTSRARHERFAAQIRNFMDELRVQYAPLVFRKATLAPGDYDRAPRFAFRDETTNSVARRVGLGLVGLLLPTFVISGFALMRLRRYPLTG